MNNSEAYYVPFIPVPDKETEMRQFSVLRSTLSGDIPRQVYMAEKTASTIQEDLIIESNANYGLLFSSSS